MDYVPTFVSQLLPFADRGELTEFLAFMGLIIHKLKVCKFWAG